MTVLNVISSANLTNDPKAKVLRLSEESIFTELFSLAYHDVVEEGKKRFSDFKVGKAFHTLMKEIKQNPNLARPRLLNLKNPEGGSQTFYSKSIFDELAKHYATRKIA